MTEITQEGGKKGSLGVLRQLKDAEARSEERLAISQKETEAELEEARRNALKTIKDAMEQAELLREERLREGARIATEEARGLVTQANLEAAKIAPFSSLNIEKLYPDLLQALFGDLMGKTEGKKPEKR